MTTAHGHIELAPTPLGKLSIVTCSPLPETSFFGHGQKPATALEDKGIRFTLEESGDQRYVHFLDNETQTLVGWLIFDNGLPQPSGYVDLDFAEGYEAWYRWNHLEVRADRSGPRFSVACGVGRNLWQNCRMDPSLLGARYTFAQLLPGPAHCAWIMRPGTPFAVKSFKEVGSGETGGIKFRVAEYEYILFALQRPRQDQSPGKVGLERISQDGDFAVLRYEGGELDAFWNISKTRIKRWG